MKSFGKFLGSTFAVSLVILVFAFFIYDIINFQPRVLEIERLIKNAHSEDRSPPEIISQLVHISNQKEAGTSAAVARLLLFKFELTQNNGMPGGWHMRNLVWWGLVNVHYTNEEILSLYCLLIWNGENYGLNNLALREFNKPLSKLSVSEAATLVTITRAPSRFKNNPDELEIRKNMLLLKVENAT